MTKLLFVSNIVKRVGSFSVASINAAHELGIEFHMAANWATSLDCQNEDEDTFKITIHNIDLARSPYSLKNIKAYKKLCQIIKDEKIDIIHCNTPVGGILGRLAGKKCGVKRVIYQAHGFHFYKGAAKKNWVIYYPVEKWLAHKTDAIITINKEDHELANKKFRLRGNGKVYYVPGVGIDTTQYEMDKSIRDEKRKELGLKDNDVALLSAGELNQNKNNRVVILAMAEIRNSSLHYYLCGVGDEREKLERLVKELGLNNNVHFLGYRTDMHDLYFASDVFVMPSFREGLSRSVMEAMASGLPCIVSNIRGNTDLIDNGYGGFTVSPSDSENMAKSITALCENRDKMISFGRYNIKKVKEFSREKVQSELEKIYTNKT